MKHHSDQQPNPETEAKFTDIPYVTLWPRLNTKSPTHGHRVCSPVGDVAPFQ